MASCFAFFLLVLVDQDMALQGGLLFAESVGDIGVWGENMIGMIVWIRGCEISGRFLNGEGDRLKCSLLAVRN